MFRIKWLLRTLLWLVSLAIGIGLFEISVRILKIDYNINPNWKYHPVIGWSQVPNAKYDYLVDGRKVHVEFNSKGFHDVEHSFQKPAGTRRIVVVGDSFCEAIQVNLEENFFRRLEGMLNRREKDKWEVINLGVGDFGTAQEWVALTQLGMDYSPDVVICEIFPLNDICNNTIELYDSCKSENDRYRPYFVMSGGELKLTSAQPFRNSLRHRFVSYGVIERALLRVLRRLHDVDPDERYAQRIQQMGITPHGPLLYTYVSDQEQPETVAKGWQVTERILEKISSLCREKNIQFIPVVVPFEACVGPKNWRDFTSGFPPPRMIQDYPEKRLGRLFDRLAQPAVFLKEPFERNLDVVLPYVGGHLNAEGNRIAAEAIYSKMVESGVAH